MNHTEEEILEDALRLEFGKNPNAGIKQISRLFNDNSVLMSEGNTIDIVFGLTEYGSKDGTLTVISVLNDFEPISFNYQSLLLLVKKVTLRKAE